MRDKETIQKTVVTLVLVSWFLLMPHTGYCPDSNDLEHFTYLLSHANILHLAGNLFVLWLMRLKNLYAALLIAVLASYMPAVGSIWDGFAFDSITIGFSGVLFAIVGTGWGWAIRNTDDTLQRTIWYRQFATKVLPFAILGLFVPHINWCLHTYCLLAGFIYGRC